MKQEDIFTPDNTRWEYDEENKDRYLVYIGSLEELSKETGIGEDQLYELLGEYESLSEEESEEAYDIMEARRGDY